MCQVIDAGLVLQRAGEGKATAFLRADGAGVVVWARAKGPEFEPYTALVRRQLPPATGVNGRADTAPGGGVRLITGNDLAGLLGFLGADVKEGYVARNMPAVLAWMRQPDGGCPLVGADKHVVACQWRGAEADGGADPGPYAEHAETARMVLDYDPTTDPDALCEVTPKGLTKTAMRMANIISRRQGDIAQDGAAPAKARKAAKKSKKSKAAKGKKA